MNVIHRGNVKTTDNLHDCLQIEGSGRSVSRSADFIFSGHSSPEVQGRAHVFRVFLTAVDTYA